MLCEEVKLMFRGDTHRLYTRLRRRCTEPPAGSLPELDKVRTIRSFYAGIAPSERQLLLAWAKKEAAGIGLIPAALSGVPLIGLIFAPLIQQSVRRMAPWVWLVLWAVGGAAFVAGIYIHHRQKAYTALHVYILESLCNQTISSTQAGVTASFDPLHALGTEDRSQGGDTAHH